MRGASALAKRASAIVDRARPSVDGLVILIYHRVGARTPISVDLPIALFSEQMEYLAEHFDALSLDEASDRLTGVSEGGDRPAVVITFDDGTADFVDEALPVLVQWRLPVTYYLATDFVEHGIAFPNGGVPMSWAAAREAVATGLVELGSHTHSHALLDRMTSVDAAAELERSIDLIGEQTGVVARHFAYPKAVLGSPAAETEVRRRFRTAVVAGTRPNPYQGSDLHRLTRSPIQASDGIRYFMLKAAGGLRLENDLRDVVNRWRYRGATH